MQSGSQQGPLAPGSYYDFPQHEPGLGQPVVMAGLVYCLGFLDCGLRRNDEIGGRDDEISGRNDEISGRNDGGGQSPSPQPSPTRGEGECPPSGERGNVRQGVKNPPLP